MGPRRSILKNARPSWKTYAVGSLIAGVGAVLLYWLDPGMPMLTSTAVLAFFAVAYSISSVRLLMNQLQNGNDE